MSSDRKLKGLLAQRDSTIAKIKDLKKVADQALTDPNVHTNFKCRYKRIDAIFENFEAIHNEIISIFAVVEGADLGPHHEISSAFNDDYYYIQALYEQLIVDSSFTENKESHCKVRLPKLELPTFDGDLRQWQTYSDVFDSLIHNNTALSDIDKYNYLISSLKGNALSVVKCTPITSANYLIAYSALRKRYENKRLIAAAHWQTIERTKRINVVDNLMGLRVLIDTFSENLSALENLNFPVKQWDFVVFSMLFDRLDSVTQTRFELECGSSLILHHYYRTLCEFLERQCNAWDNVALCNSNTRKSDIPKNKPVYKNIAGKGGMSSSFLVNSSASTSACCSFCSQSHLIYSCPKFLNKSAKERYALVKNKRWCTNCLGDKHTASNCKSKSVCRKCSQQHHTLLHFGSDSLTEGAATSTTGTDSSEDVKDSVNLFVNSQRTILLSTALVNILDNSGEYRTLRALLDSASQSSFMTKRCCDFLRLPTTALSVNIKGVGQTATKANRGVSCILKPHNSDEPELNVDFVIIPQICSNMPQATIPRSKFEKFSNLTLADPDFNKSAPVDLLLGADIFAQVLRGTSIRSSADEPVALDTVFGHVIIGNIDLAPTKIVNSFLEYYDNSLEGFVRRFWELEQVEAREVPSPEDSLAEKNFVETLARSESGRFIVSLPFVDSVPVFGDTRQKTLKRFLSLEKRLISHPLLYQQYREFMQDYLDQGHMQLITENFENPSVYYIPHHCVLKPESLTTKLRVVFDASHKGPNGLSLNDTLLRGPKLHQDISSVLSRFRLHAVCFTSDIRQMFRQILVRTDHLDFQRILWRFNQSEPIREYRLTTLVFGIKSSPFIAMRCIKQVANENKFAYPIACSILEEDTFVDDIVSGADSLAEALQVQSDLTHILKKSGFELRKWASNDPQFLAHLSDSVEQTQSITLDLEPDSTLKILGLQWNPSTDSFSYSVKPLGETCSKRSVLSELARIYDPLGFLTPFVLNLKHLIQQLWSLGLDWDSSPPDHIIQIWSHIKKEMCQLSNITIPRFLASEGMRSCQLHGFCDASNVGYAAVVYVRLIQADNSISAHLLCAKSRVAPLKRISIPRLELSAALLLAELLHKIQKDFERKLQFDRIFAYSDSTVALSWIKSSPHKWTCFVANRVTTIQGLTPPSLWYHVGSSENPADPASRGVTPVTLVGLSLWWAGPSWLKLAEEKWPSNIILKDKELLPETDCEKLSSVLTVTVDESSDFIQDLLNKFSSLDKMQRIVAYVKRFIFNCRNPKSAIKGMITLFDSEAALNEMVRSTQNSVFAREMTLLSQKKALPKPLRKLSPFLDKLGILRVGGRLVHSGLKFEQIHPALLPGDHRLTHLLIESLHRKYLHPGILSLHNLLVQKYWIFSAKRNIRKVLSKCNRCFRVKPLHVQPIMGDIPAVRITQIKPFSSAGVDYGGAFTIVMSRTRGCKVLKAYICLFVCMATKAIHLELASDLSSEAFLAALRRFIGRRGQCYHIYSDQGTTFRGAARTLVKIMKESAESEGIIFHTIPPYSPNFGGLWEAGIKSTKGHLLRVVGDQLLTYEEFSTVLVQIESMLNSRPLTPLSSDPNDMNPLTPGHFLTLAPLNSLPEQNFLDSKINRLSRWQLVQRLSQEFWSRWHKEYLHTLLQRSKWCNSSVPIQLNTLVLLKDELSPPLKWHLGRVIELHSGSDAVTRVVTVRTTKGIFKRPVSKVCPLPSQ